jgi:hypothetical protein
MGFAKSVIVVVPGCSAELVRELFHSSILPQDMAVEVLLPPEITRDYVGLIEGKEFKGVNFLRSSSSRFFSKKHLRWLSEKLRLVGKPQVLITKSPYRDPIIAIIALLILLLSGKTITLLRKNQENLNPVCDTVGDQRPVLPWFAVDVNFEVLLNEIFGRITPILPWNKWEILYFAMFAGLLIRRYLTPLGLCLKWCLTELPAFGRRKFEAKFKIMAK